MTQLEQERLFAELARAYVRADGAALLGEQADLPAAPPTPRLDARVARIGRADARRRALRWLPGAAVMAAGLLLAVFLGNPSLIRLPSVSYAPPPAAPHESPTASPPQASPAPPGMSDAPGWETAYSLSSLSFPLPDNLTISAVDTDRGQVIYRLDDTLHDDVVLTLEYAENAPGFTGLRAAALGDVPVYGKAAAGYHLLAFELDGVVYTMTCRYDMNTLIKFAEAILL